MNTTNYTWRRSLIGAAIAASLFAGCASAPKPPAGSAEVRAKLTALQGDATLATRAPVAIKDAELAVTQAEIPEPDLSLAAHRVYIADRKVDTATALAQTKFAEEERTALNEQSEKARLDSRTHEADLAKSAAVSALAESENQKVAATSARSDADAAQLAANVSQQQASELQRQLEILQARPTDRGLVLTLGDTLFATGKSELKSGATANLDRLTRIHDGIPAAYRGDRRLHGQHGQRRVQPGPLAAPCRLGEELSRPAGRRNIPAQFRGSRRECPGGRQ